MPGLGLQTGPNDDDRNKASAVMKRIGTDLLKKSKASHHDEDNRSSGRKDIISVLIQANAMEDLPGRMPDEDVLDRVYKLILNQTVYLTPTYRDPYFHYRWSRNHKVHTFEEQM